MFHFGFRSGAPAHVLLGFCSGSALVSAPWSALGYALDFALGSAPGANFQLESEDIRTFKQEGATATNYEAFVQQYWAKTLMHFDLISSRLKQA